MTKEPHAVQADTRRLKALMGLSTTSQPQGGDRVFERNFVAPPTAGPSQCYANDSKMAPGPRSSKQ